MKGDLLFILFFQEKDDFIGPDQPEFLPGHFFQVKRILFQPVDFPIHSLIFPVQVLVVVDDDFPFFGQGLNLLQTLIALQRQKQQAQRQNQEQGQEKPAR
jgi:hypothetical protein